MSRFCMECQSRPIGCPSVIKLYPSTRFLPHQNHDFTVNRMLFSLSSSLSEAQKVKQPINQQTTFSQSSETRTKLGQGSVNACEVIERLSERAVHVLSSHSPLDSLIMPLDDDERDAFLKLRAALETRHFKERRFTTGIILSPIPASCSEQEQPQPDAFVLMRAAREGNAKLVAAMMRQGIHPEAAESLIATTTTNSTTTLTTLATTWTPLHEACRRGHYRVVQEFLRHGVPCNIHSDRFGRTPFLVACENNHEAVVQVLLERGVDRNQSVDFSGDTALHRVMATQNLGMAQRLLDAGADLHRRNKQHETVLQSIGDTESSVQYDLDLLSKHQCYSEIVAVVLQSFRLHQDEQAFLLRLRKCGLAKEQKENVSFSSNMSIISMLRRTNAEGQTLVQFIREKFGRVEADAFSRMCSRAFLYRALACPAQRLRSTASLGNVKEFKTALAQMQNTIEETGSIDLNQAAANEEGLTPLHCACLYGQDEIVGFLLDSGANLWAETSSGQTPLSMAIRAEQLNVVQEILRRLLWRKADK